MKVSIDTNLLNLMRQAICDHDVLESVNEESKLVEDYVSFNYENFRKTLLSFYQRGFEDGYKTGVGAPKDEYGNWADQSD